MEAALAISFQTSRTKREKRRVWGSFGLEQSPIGYYDSSSSNLVSPRFRIIFFISLCLVGLNFNYYAIVFRTMLSNTLYYSWFLLTIQKKTQISQLRTQLTTGKGAGPTRARQNAQASVVGVRKRARASCE